MKIKSVLIVSFVFLCLCVLVGCDPTYPPGKLKVANIDPISQGETITIDIIYPNEGGTIVFGWKDQNVEILSGGEFLSVSGLSITGITTGSASIRVNATTVISDEAAKSGYEEKVYSIVLTITVE